MKCYGSYSWEKVTPEQRESKNASRRAKYQSDPDLRAKLSSERTEKYHSDPKFREEHIRSASKSYWNNPERFCQNQLERYYNNHSENLDKLRLIREEKHFNGNRQAALERDGFKCVLCEASEDLVVHHKMEMDKGKRNLITILKISKLFVVPAT
ncbi:MULTISPECIES: hypothetical protein [unclassified Microcoleus]|uniref:hypothetical protein n=1 Tax=unclassified Microcoleus TaxID=2642155 RepID=UPI002FD20861